MLSDWADECFSDKVDIYRRSDDGRDVASATVPRYTAAQRAVPCSVDDATQVLVPDLDALGVRVDTVVTFQSDPGVDQGDHIVPWSGDAPPPSYLGGLPPEDGVVPLVVVRTRRSGILTARLWRVDCKKTF